MSTKKYTVAIRGMLARVLDKTSAAIYSAPKASAKTGNVIKGPATAGMVTGWKITSAGTIWVEILQPQASLLLPVITIYLLDDDLTFEPNPDYDPAKDLDKPYDSDKIIIEPDVTTPKGGTTGGTTTGGTGQGGTVIEEGDDPDNKGGGTTPDDTAPVDKTKKWLTYGLYAVLGVALITLTIIIVKSLKKPKLATK